MFGKTIFFRKLDQKSRDIDLISKAHLFDATWYLSQNSKGSRGLADPLAHYVGQGGSEKRHPHPLFDTDWYLAQNADFNPRHVNPLAHYIKHGASQGRDPHPLFDTDWYLAENPDIDVRHINPLTHFLQRGALEGRDPHPLFDTDWYVAQNPDVAAIGINPLIHYVATGASEGRDPHPLFDTGWYLAQNPDVTPGQINPLAHYIAHGASEGHNPHPLFDTDWYLAQNPDVARGEVNALAHYLVQGTQEDLDPHPLFNTNWYLAQNPEVASGQLNPLVHFVTTGAAEGCDPNPLFDTDWYLAQNPDVVRLQLNPLVHYLATGASEGRQPNWSFDVQSYLALNPGANKVGAGPLIHCLATTARAQRRRDAAFAAAVKAFNELAAIEPELLKSCGRSTVKKLKWVTGHVPSLRFAAWRKLFESFTEAYDRIVFVPRIAPCEDHSAFSVALGVFEVARQRGRGSALLVVPDQNIFVYESLPLECHIRLLSDLDRRLSLADRLEIVAALVYHVQPKAVLNVDSYIVWQAIAERGAALSRVTKLYGYIPKATSIDQHTPRHLIRCCLPHVTQMYSDDATIFDQLVRACGTSEDLRSRLTLVNSSDSLDSTFIAGPFFSKDSV